MRFVRRQMRLRARFDVNGDGRLEPPERAALRAYRFARLLRRFDRNGDGRVGPGEVPPTVARRLRRFDLNGDGWVDAAELQAAARARRAGAPRPPQP